MADIIYILFEMALALLAGKGTTLQEAKSRFDDVPRRDKILAISVVATVIISPFVIILLYSILIES
jgi:hypothetical protein